MIEELTSFEIKKIFGDDLKPSTYKILYDLILDLQKQFTQMGIDNDTFKAQLRATITDKIKAELQNLLSTNQLQTIISNSLNDKFREVIEARKGFESLGKRLDSVDLQLDNTTEKINILNKNTRIFHPNFGVNFYLGQADDLNGKVTVKTLEKCKETIEPMLPYLDEIPIVFHISYNENTSKYYIVEPISTMKPLVEWIQLHGVKVPAVKMYAQKFTISNATSVYGTVTDFHREWKKIMIEIAEAFKDLNITYFSVHNEVNDVCGDTNHLPYVLDEISTLKRYGYKVVTSVLKPIILKKLK